MDKKLEINFSPISHPSNHHSGLKFDAIKSYRSVKSNRYQHHWLKYGAYYEEVMVSIVLLLHRSVINRMIKGEIIHFYQKTRRTEPNFQLCIGGREVRWRGLINFYLRGETNCQTHANTLCLSGLHSSGLVPKWIATISFQAKERWPSLMSFP